MAASSNPASKTDAALDVLLDGERIAEIAAPGKFLHDTRNAEVFDAANLIVARPASSTCTCTCASPGQDSSETIDTGHALCGPRRLHRRLLHAQHQTGKRQRQHHPLHHR